MKKVEKIGEGLVRIGAMTQEQVQKIIKKQNNGDPRMFGEIAINLGFVDDQAIRDYLNR